MNEDEATRKEIAFDKMSRGWALDLKDSKRKLLHLDMGAAQLVGVYINRLRRKLERQPKPDYDKFISIDTELPIQNARINRNNDPYEKQEPRIDTDHTDFHTYKTEIFSNSWSENKFNLRIIRSYVCSTSWMCCPAWKNAPRKDLPNLTPLTWKARQEALPAR